jgi:two-component system, response regulator, stage 0 sporulation protein F
MSAHTTLSLNAFHAHSVMPQRWKEFQAGGDIGGMVERSVPAIPLLRSLAKCGNFPTCTQGRMRSNVAPSRPRTTIFADEIALHFAFSGEAALATLKRQEAGPVGLILPDINMPGMSGLELLKRIKACYAHLKVFLLTAYSDAYNYDTAMQYGADDYLTKPIDFAALKQKIQAL